MLLHNPQPLYRTLYTFHIFSLFVDDMWILFKRKIIFSRLDKNFAHRAPILQLDYTLIGTHFL